MTDHTMSDEAYVRSRWEGVRLLENDYYEPPRHLIVAEFKEESGLILASEHSAPSAWSAANDFTIQREEEIRQLREEIAVLIDDGGEDGWGDCELAEPAYRRILARLESALAEKRKGMKERCPECGSAAKVAAGDPEIHECDRCYTAWKRAEERKEQG